jgi:hypothetical protein
MSYIGATGYTQYEERFQDIEGNISYISKDLYVGNYSITSNLNRVIHTSSNIFSNLYIGDNCITSNIIKLQTREGITYDDLYVGDNSFASNIQYLKNEVQNETQSLPTKTAIYRIKDLETKFEHINNGYSGGNLIDAETGALLGNTIANGFSSIGANIANIGNTAAIWYFLGQCAIAAQVGQTRAETANTKADKSLGIWDEDGNNTYNKKTGNVGIGTSFGSTLNNRLECNGNINIPTGSTFRINNVNFGYSNLDHKLLAGTNINIDNDYKINSTYTYSLPTAGIGTNGELGGVRVDNSTITINGSGVITSTGGLPATIRLTPTATDGFYSWINSQALLAKTPATGVLYSSGSADGDIVLRSDTDRALILQSGIGDPAITLTAGTNRVRMHQRVGINTLPNTNYWLDVNGSINATELRVGGNLISISPWITSGNEISYNNGNVGIGTNIPNFPLHLHKTATLQDVRLQITDGTSTTASTRGLAIGKGTDNRSFIYNYENTGLFFGTNAAERMTISNTGNVGIGTNIPNFPLHLHKTATLQDVRIQITDGTTGTITNKGLHIIKGTDNVGYLYNYENKDLVFGTNATERIRILANGNVGIGTGIPQRRLHIQAALRIGGSSAVIDFGDDSNTQIYRFGTANELRFTTNGIDRLMILSDASVRTPLGGAFIAQANIARGGGYDVRTFSDSTGMYLEMGNENTFIPHYFRLGSYGGVSFIESGYSKNIVFRVYSSFIPTGTYKQWAFNEGGLSYNGLNSSTWTIPSDHRIKENIVKADLKTCYDNVKNINLYRYNFIDAFETGSNDKNKLGYIAQEVEKYFPKATYRQKKRLNDKREVPDLLSIDVEQVNLTLYGAVKQLIKIVEKQNKRIKVLETLLNIEDNDETENDAGEEYVRIETDECNIDDIEPTEPSTDV